MEIIYRPIGIIHTPFAERRGTPIQPAAAAGAVGHIEIAECYRAGLKDLDGFSHLILLYHFHLSSGYEMEVTPFLDTQPRGLFSTRAPKRPNAIGLSVVRLTAIHDGILEVADVDMLDGTPLLDIKPYVPQLNPAEVERIGWFSGAVTDLQGRTADERFR